MIIGYFKKESVSHPASLFIAFTCAGDLFLISDGERNRSAILELLESDLPADSKMLSLPDNHIQFITDLITGFVYDIKILQDLLERDFGAVTDLSKIMKKMIISLQEKFCEETRSLVPSEQIEVNPTDTGDHLILQELKGKIPQIEQSSSKNAISLDFLQYLTQPGIQCNDLQLIVQPLNCALKQAVQKGMSEGIEFLRNTFMSADALV